MRSAVIGTLALAASAAAADPRSRHDASLASWFDASMFVGVGYLDSDLQLGDSWAPEQVPGSAPLLGARLHVVVAPDLAHDDHFRIQLGVEGELAFATAFTGSTMGSGPAGGGRDSYFAPVLGWRGHARLTLTADDGPLPHLVAGVGGATVASSSPFMRKETDPVFYWGPGVSFPVSDRWAVRVDGRHGIMAAKIGVTSTFELQFGVVATFGLPTRRVGPRRAAPPPPQPEVDETDTDGDGLPDRLDSCKTEPETVNGIGDADGCPELDGDADGIVEGKDRCPGLAEDLDGYQDEDGCPEPDNDGDGLEDGRDVCPMRPEDKNGLDDDDGCPDQVPPEVEKALATTVRFEKGRARVTPAAKKATAPLLVQLKKHRGLRLLVVGRPDAAGNEDLAKRRAEALKWSLIDQGIAEDRIEATVGDVDAKRAIELRLLVK